MARSLKATWMRKIVCLNDGRYIIVNMNTRKESVKDLTLMWSSIAP